MINRYLCPSIKAALKDTPVILIIGARQTGKSTLCKQLTENNIFNGASITMDDPTILAAAQSDPLGLLESQQKHIIIDEVQRAPELFLCIKKLIDEDRQGRRIILTGSANVMILPKVADSLAGRIEIHNLWPLSQSEINGHKSNFVDTLLSKEGVFPNKKCDWGEIVGLIRKGGYPEVIQRDTDARRQKWFESYITAILQKDVKELANIEGLMQLPNILHLIATRVSSTINLSDIARLSGVKNSTLQRYVALLEQVFLIVRIPAWTPNTEGQFVKSPKIVLNDTGLLCHLRGEGEHLLTDRTTTGGLLENFVVMEIIKQLSWADETLKPYHFSIHKGSEVDLVLEDKRKNLYGIEIKSKSTINAKDFKGLKHLAELSGERFKKGILLYTGSQTVGGFGGKNLQAVPISNLW